MAEGLFYTAGVSGGMCVYVEKVEEGGGSRVLTPPILVRSANLYTCLRLHRARRGALCSVCSQCECREEESTLTHRGPYDPPPPAEAPPPKLHPQEVCVFVFWMSMNRGEGGFPPK